MTLNHSADNLTSDNCTLLPYYIHSAGMAISYILSYLLVLLLCIVGNGLVCLVIIRNRNMRSVTNLFILNLAVSDLLVGVFCVPTTLIDSLISGWPFNQITCTMSNLVQGMSVSASVFTLVAIAVDRFCRAGTHVDNMPNVFENTTDQDHRGWGYSTAEAGHEEDVAA